MIGNESQSSAELLPQNSGQSAETVVSATIPSVVIGQKLAPYNPTNLEAVHIALNLLQITSSDILYDLGCGDGRLLIEVSAYFV